MSACGTCINFLITLIIFSPFSLTCSGVQSKLIEEEIQRLVARNGARDHVVETGRDDHDGRGAQRREDGPVRDDWRSLCHRNIMIRGIFVFPVR